MLVVLNLQLATHTKITSRLFLSTSQAINLQPQVFIIHLLTHKANTRDHQPPLFRAKCSTWAQDNPFSFISCSNDLLHVSFGPPHLRLPAFSVHINAIRFGIASDGILITCPIQVHLLRLFSVIMDDVDVFRCNSIFEMVLGQNIFKILRRHIYSETLLTYD